MSSSETSDGRQSSHDGDSGNHRVATWGVLSLIVIAAVLVFLVYRGGLRQGGATAEIEHRMELTRTALAATENLESVDADGSWSELFAETPDDPAVAVNRAINRLLRVDELSAQATNASLEDSERMQARAQLPDAIAGARQAISDYEKLADNPVTAMWFKSRVDLHEASLLPASMTKSLRRDVYQRLAGAINGPEGKTPEAMILGGSLIQVVEQLEDPIDGLPNDLLADAAKTVGVLSDQHGDNLYFALRAARLGIATKDAGAARYVRRASELAKAIEPSVRRETEPIGVTPDQLVNQIVEAINAGNWSEAENRMLLWFNVLNSTEIVKTDRRRASPHPLDLLSFDSLRRLSAEVVAATPLDAVETEIVFEARTPSGNGSAQAATAIDFDLDLDADLVTLDSENRIRLWRNDGTGQLESISELQLDQRYVGMIAADLFLVDSSNPSRLRSDRAALATDTTDLGAAVRHNTFLSLLLFGPDGLRLIQIDGRESVEDASRLQAVDSTTGLETVVGVIAAIAGDLEADGDLDLVVSTQSDGIRMFVNRGNRSFFELDDPLGQFGVDDPAVDMAIADLDRDLDLDLVTVHRSSGRVGFIENLLHLQFRGRYLNEITSVEEADSIFVEDIDGNVSWDLIVGGGEDVVLVFSQTSDAGAWNIDRTQVSDHAGTGMAVGDFDNDSWMDLLVDASGQVDLCRIGPWGFEDWSAVASAAGISELVVDDFDRDGAVDLAGIRDGALTVRINQTRNLGHHLDVRFKGIDDNASGRVNHYAIGSTLELRFGPHYRARVVTSPSTHFGLDGYQSASSVRAILPNGLTQTVRNPKIDSLVEEEQTLKGSCPYLYAWDGEKFVFKTDCLWAAPLGLQVAHGVVAKDRPWEYLKIDGGDVRPLGDHYEFRITEELWEVAYFDKVAVSVVDHPAGIEVWTNEKVGPDEIATPTIFAFASDDLQPVVAAKDTAGRDVTTQLLESDRDFVKAFDYRLRQGLCPPHWIDLDFGTLSAAGGLADSNAHANNVYLVLTGWILPTDTSLNIQIDQNPELGPIEFPSVWVPDADAAEGWRMAIPYMGFPGGKTKTIVVDVSDVVNRDDPRFRIRTSAQIYWDQARIAVQSEPASFVEQPLSLLEAEVTVHGFSDRIRKDERHPETYDYQKASELPRWPPLRGGLTRLGDCTELVRQWDDAMVVMGAGDEIRLRFSLPETPLPAGWKRDFVVHSIGWDKDADLNTLAGQSTEPLPYRGMTAYPPPVGDGSRLKRLETLNRPHLQRTQSFRSFWYRSEPTSQGLGKTVENPQSRSR